jgi:hypothetical protein
VAGFKADAVAKSVVDAYLNDNFMAKMLKDVYKAQVRGPGSMR